MQMFSVYTVSLEKIKLKYMFFREPMYCRVHTILGSWKLFVRLSKRYLVQTYNTYSVHGSHPLSDLWEEGR